MPWFDVFGADPHERQKCVWFSPPTLHREFASRCIPHHFSVFQQFIRDYIRLNQLWVTVDRLNRPHFLVLVFSFLSLLFFLFDLFWSNDAHAHARTQIHMVIQSESSQKLRVSGRQAALLGPLNTSQARCDGQADRKWHVREDSFTILSHEPTRVISCITTIKRPWGILGAQVNNVAAFCLLVCRCILRHRQKDNAPPAHVKQPNVVTIPVGLPAGWSGTPRDLNDFESRKRMEKACWEDFDKEFFRSKQSKPVQQQLYFLPSADSRRQAQEQWAELRRRTFFWFLLNFKLHWTLSGFRGTFLWKSRHSMHLTWQRLFATASAFWPLTTTWPGSPDSWGKAWHVLRHRSVTMSWHVLTSGTMGHHDPRESNGSNCDGQSLDSFNDRSNIFQALTKLKEASSSGSDFWMHWHLRVNKIQWLQCQQPRIQSVEMAVQAGLVRFVGEKNFKMDKDLKAKDPVCPCELLPHFDTT